MKSCCCVYKHANRQALVHACFRKMEIPTEVWADAIEVRGIALWVAGFDRPWDVTIGTLSSVSAMHAVFGEDLRRTVTMRVDVEILLDVKRLDATTATVEVEVGAAGQYQYFESIGKKGRLVLPPGGANGVLIDMILDQNPRTYPYHDTDWQEAAKHYGVQHIYNTLTAHIADDAAKQRVTVECFAVTPLNTNLYLQEAKGLALALHIKGVQFVDDDEADGFGMVPVPLRHQNITGGVSADGLEPTVGPVNFRIRSKIFLQQGKSCKISEGKWLAPLLVTQEVGRAAVAGEEPKFSHLRTVARRFNRRAAEREKKATASTLVAHPGAAKINGKRRVVDGTSSAEEGEVSDGGESHASSSVSKLARKAQNGFDIR